MNASPSRRYSSDWARSDNDPPIHRRDRHFAPGAECVQSAQARRAVHAVEDSPPTTDEAQAVAYAVLALTLAPYVDGLDAPALGDARDGGAGAYGGGGNSDSRFYDRTLVYSPTNHYATAPSDRMDYMTARALAGSKLLRKGRRGSHGAPTAPLQDHYRSRLSNFIRLLSWWRSSPGWRGVGNPLPPRVDLDPPAV